MNAPAKVGEIFTAAGAAFNKLAEIIVLLHPGADSPSGGKWTDQDIEVFRSAITKFQDELQSLTDTMKRRTVSQLRTTLKKKSFEDAGIPVRQLVTSQQQPQQIINKSADVTLNMLNAPESEVDVEGMHEDVKLEFGSEETITS